MFDEEKNNRKCEYIYTYLFIYILWNNVIVSPEPHNVYQKLYYIPNVYLAALLIGLSGFYLCRYIFRFTIYAAKSALCRHAIHLHRQTQASAHTHTHPIWVNQFVSSSILFSLWILRETWIRQISFFVDYICSGITIFLLLLLNSNT